MIVPSAPVLEECGTLDDLWLHVSELNRTHFPMNEFRPILGGGKTFRPNIMFVFINPTAANISSDRNWDGPRFPFIGTRHVWKVFCRSGLIDQQLMDRINEGWSPHFAEEVLRLLKRKSFYLTNIVKWTGPDGALPDNEKIRLFLPVLKREIELVKPEYIITFGLIPFERLTGLRIKLSDYHASVLHNKKLEYFDINVNSTRSKVVPCYFPVGRGDPKKAADILRFVNKL